MSYLLALDAPSVAVLVTAATGAILGLLGFLRGAKADDTAAHASERTVAREEFDSVVEAQREMIANFRLDLAKCESDKVAQQAQINDLRERLNRLEGKL